MFHIIGDLLVTCQVVAFNTHRDAKRISGDAAALETDRNTAQVTINWRFATTDARSKLAWLYPKLTSEAL
jgi:hypothetical protein